MISRIFSDFKELNSEEKWILINLILILASVYTATIVMIYNAFRILFNSEKRKHILSFSNRPLLISWAALSILTALYYQNWYGIACFFVALIIIIFIVDTWSKMNKKLSACMIKLMTLLSFPIFFIAMIQHMMGLERVFSTFYNPNYYAFFSEIMIILCCYQILMNKQRLLSSFALLVNIIGICLSGCRSAWLAAVFGILILAIALNHKKLLGLIGGVSAIGITAIILNPSLIPRFDTFSESLILREAIWSTAWQGFWEHPIFGQGFLSYRFYTLGMDAVHYTGNAVITHAHNIYLDMLINFGIAGSFLLVLFFFLVIKEWVSMKNSNPLASLSLAIFTALLIHGISDVPIIGFQTGALFMVFLTLPGLIKQSRPMETPVMLNRNNLVTPYTGKAKKQS